VNARNVGVLILAVAVVDAGIVVAVRRPSSEANCPPTPVASAKHFGGFANNRGWFGVDPALDADNHALQAFLDARVHGTCAAAWIGRGVKIGGGTIKGWYGTYYGWDLYWFHESPWCVPLHFNPSQILGSKERYSGYSIGSRLLTDPKNDGELPTAYGGAGGHFGIGNKIAAAPGRNTYAFSMDAPDPGSALVGGSQRYFIDVVGPGVNRFGKRLPAVILGEFEQGITISGCGAGPNTPLVMQ
jgi:hypothetical protein